ncbi:MAG: hypothetical protein M5U34_31490 [Chloroflexi bacterium]|nr:hypothetical protein [Chloroflexota bacterium]
MATCSYTHRATATSPTRLPMLPVADVEAVIAAINSQPNVLAVSQRINTAGLISNRDASNAVNITAIEPAIRSAY